MTRKVRMITSVFIITSIFFFATQYHLYRYDFISAINDVPKITITISSKNIENFAVHENISSPVTPVNSLLPDSISSVSILMPDWEVFVIVSPDYTHLISPHDPYICEFETGEVSPAISAGELQFPIRSLFKCELPKRARRRLPFKQPKLMKSSENRNITPAPGKSLEMLRWTFLVYDSLTTDDDVVLFVKGLNNRQGLIENLVNLSVFLGMRVIR
uniref:Uncharacterized protein n=1 Tax=Solanum tuberosum TaxID=4113 RepID=M1CVG9_SOLTU